MLTRQSSGAGFLEERDRLDLLDGQRQVDDPFRILVGAAAFLRELLVDIHGGDTAGRIELHLAEDGPKQLQASEAVAVEDRTGDRGRIDARLDALAADVEGPRRNAASNGTSRCR